VFIACWTQPLANEIPDMAQDNKNKVTDIRREEDVIWWVLFGMGRKGCALFMLANGSVLFVSTVAKFCVNSSEDLFRCRWAQGKQEAIGIGGGVARVLVFMQNRVF